MTRKKIAIALVTATAVAAPSTALARSHAEDHHHHAKRHHHHHVKKVKKVQVVTPAPSSTTPSSTTPPAATTATVTSFANGLLTITRSDGKAFTAKVTRATEIECKAAAVPTASAARHGSDDPSGDDNSGSGSGRSGGSDDNSGPGNSSDDRNDDDGAGHDQGDDNGVDAVDDDNEHCGTAALTAGTQVREAKLVRTDAGSTWTKLELVR